MKYFGLSVIFCACVVSCTPNSQVKTNNTPAQNNQQTKNTVAKLFEANTGKTEYEAKMFENKDFRMRMEKLLGKRFQERIRYFNVQSPIVFANGAYKFTGCEIHNCAGNSTIIFYMPENDNLMVCIEHDDTKEVFAEKGSFQPTENLLRK